MGMNLARLEDGEEFTCSNGYWNLILDSAKKEGWKPLGTTKYDEAMKKDTTWNSSDYNSNNGQVVNDEDAYQLSKSLKQYLSKEKENITHDEHDIIAQFIEWLKIDDEVDDGIDYYPGFEIY